MKTYLSNWKLKILLYNHKKMLVLNTNEWGWIKYSNSMLSWYPDFWQILIMPPDVSWTDTNVAFSVNWTNVNRLSQTILQSNYLWWNNAWWDIWSSSISLQSRWQEWSTAQTISRIWFYKPLEWWETIWKECIIWPVLIYWSAASNNEGHAWSVSWTITPKILHADWSLTQITSFSIPTLSGSVDRYVQATYYKTSWPMVNYTNWIKAQSWDYVVVDLDITSTSSALGAIAWFSFWCLWSSNIILQPKPIQISLD